MKKVTINNFILPVVLLGIFFIPFNSWSGISFLGEYFRDSCFLFFSLASILIIFRRKINIPLNNLIFQLFILFILWAFLATILNFNNVINYNFKQTSGLSRFINQYGALVIASIVIPITIFNALKNFNISRLLILVRSVILLSLIFVFIYSIIEILIVKLNMTYLKQSLLNIFDYIPFVEAKVDMRLQRISSVTFEPPALGTYLLSIAGWMFSYILTENKKWKYLPTLMVIFLGFMSGSRAAFFIIIIQFFIAILLLIKDVKSRKSIYRALSGGLILAFISLAVYNKEIYEYLNKEINSFKLDDSAHALSNKSRFGIQQAMFGVFIDNPISGTGYGLQAFESRKKYPNWAKKGNWEFRVKYLNQNDKRFPPGYNMYLRILSETGIIGLLLFALILAQIFIWCFNNFKSENRIITFIILISMIGFCLNWLKMDSFRIYFFWISLSLIWIIEKNKKFRNV
tara:strand:+ start:229 stop:1602 length:1374 start_codon:yes stop_codon:yes gene_type:complete